MAEGRSSKAAVQATNDDASVSKLFARWAALRKLLFQFLDAGKDGESDGSVKKQILSLGAGFDTTYFQLQIVNLLTVSWNCFIVPCRSNFFWVLCSGYSYGIVRI